MKNKGRLIKSIFMLIIATLFSSLCVTFAWFISIREQSVASNGISMTGMDGTLYYYNGNKIDNEWCGYPETELQASKPGATFIEYDKNDTTVTPFLMTNIKPSARFLFYIKAKVKDSSKPIFDVYFSITDWQCSFSDEQFNPAVDKTHPWTSADGIEDNVNLTRAIDVYTIDTAIPIQADKNANDAKILQWADNFASQSGVTENMFNQTTKTNKTNDVVMLNHLDQGQVKPYKFNANTEYLIPFIIEFSDDPGTWFSEVANSANEYNIDTRSGNSNVYMGQTFMFTEIALGHFDPRKA